MVDCLESLGTFKGYDPSFDTYNLYLENMPEKFMLTIAIDYSIDFPRDLITLGVTIMHVFIFVCSYLHLSELYAQVSKVLRALTDI